MRIGIYLNESYKDEIESYLDKILSALKKRKVDFKIIRAADELSDRDIVIVLGGDGTILNVASACAEYGVKILGINCGRLGFLTDFETDEIESALNVLSEEKFNCRKRAMLEVDCEGEKYLALNEAVIQRCTSGNSFTNTVGLHAEIDGSAVDDYTADGLIVSTPTGSTAYSLSAGGSILTPDLNAFIMTPICPHSLHSRPIVFSDRSVVKVTQTDRKGIINLIIDGKAVKSLDGFDCISVKKSDKTVEFITLDSNNFFDKLLIKLNIWSK